ncbi:MAG: hypothetical protein RIA64_11005 [Rhodospirillales bacterium]
MTKLIAKLSLWINNVVFFLALLAAAVFGLAGFVSFKAGEPTMSFMVTTLVPLAIVVVATLLCSMIALLGAIWIALEEGNRLRLEDPDDRPVTRGDRIDPTFSET